MLRGAFGADPVEVCSGEENDLAHFGEASEADDVRTGASGSQDEQPECCSRTLQNQRAPASVGLSYRFKLRWGQRYIRAPEPQTAQLNPQETIQQGGAPKDCNRVGRTG